jgi:hypothetical protein
VWQYDEEEQFALGCKYLRRTVDVSSLDHPLLPMLLRPKQIPCRVGRPGRHLNMDSAFVWQYDEEEQFALGCK